MNREEATKLWPIIRAFGDGEVIQFTNVDCQNWEDIGAVWVWQSLSSKYWNYRIKPKPRTVTIAYNRDTIKVCWGDEAPDLDGAKTITIELPE